MYALFEILIDYYEFEELIAVSSEHSSLVALYNKEYFEPDWVVPLVDPKEAKEKKLEHYYTIQKVKAV